jgi:competence protein ComEA
MRTARRSSLAIALVVASISPFALTPAASAVPEKAAATGTRSQVAASAPVNINTASVDQLMTLSGVGRKVAEKIVEYRTTHGVFKQPKEIRRVQGIGAGLWERNRERIVVE